MALDLNFHSYFSIFTTSDATTSASEYNPFDEDNHSSYASTSVASPDITYTSGDGKVTFGAAGTYLVVFNTGFLISANTTVVGVIKINGSAVYTSAAIFDYTTIDPLDYTFQTIINVNAGDYLEVTVDAQNTATIAAQNGTSLTMLKANGDYGNLLYTADSDAGGTAALIALFDSDNGGTVTSNLKNVTYTADEGTLTPDNTRKFLMFSTLILTVTQSSQISHFLYVNGSAVENLPVYVHKNYDPLETSLGVLKSLTADETCSARAQHASRTVVATAGTSFSIFDITNNGTDPSSFLSLSTNLDSSTMTPTGDEICFDSNNWGGGSSALATTSFVTATGITYTANGGTFVVAEAGKYFILWNLVIGSAGSAERAVIVKKNGASLWTAPWHVYSPSDPIEKTVCLIVDAAAADSFTFVVTITGNTIFDAGTAITMFKVDEVNDLHLQSVPTDSLIADDFTINGFSADGLSPQHDRVVQKQVPFLLGVPGPLSLRGRSLATTETPPNVSTGDKKN